MRNKLLKTWQKSKNVFKTSFFLTIGILLLISLFNSFVKIDYIVSLINKNFLGGIISGAAIGSLAAGSPITSYIISGELFKVEISLAVITTFILTWVTVGLVQLPAESVMLGKKFAIIRNLFSFFTAIIIALIINFILF